MIYMTCFWMHNTERQNLVTQYHAWHLGLLHRKLTSSATKLSHQEDGTDLTTEALNLAG